MHNQQQFPQFDRPKLRMLILGLSGSIGSSSADIIFENKQFFDIEAVITYGSNTLKLITQLNLFQPKYVCITSEKNYWTFKDNLSALNYSPILSCGEAEALHLASMQYDLSILGISGLIALPYAVRIAQHSKVVATANKESIVCSGDLLLRIADKYENILISIDSEHSSIMRILGNHNLTSNLNKSFEERYPNISQIFLTCSGGPLRDMSVEEIVNVGYETILQHPNWNMGPRISVDSATLMNKGLEVVEAVNLFNIDIDKVAVKMHRESIVHAIIEHSDDSMTMHASLPDMRLPIAYAMQCAIQCKYGNMYTVHLKQKKLMTKNNLALTFSELDSEKFPLFQQAKECYFDGIEALVVLNAVNEFWVQVFLEKRISFSKMVEQILLHRSAYKEIAALDINLRQYQSVEDKEVFSDNALSLYAEVFRFCSDLSFS